MKMSFTRQAIGPTRRQVVVSSLCLPFAACSKQTSDSYPQQNISFIIPYGPGGGFDAIVRVLVPTLEKNLPGDVHVLPVNIAAGGGGKGIAQLYRSKPDGYTIGIVNIPGAFTLQARQKASGFDLGKMSWLAKIGRTDRYGIGVPVTSSIRDMDDLHRLSNTRPVRFTSSGAEGTAYAATVIGTRILDIRAQIITGYKSSSDYVVAALRGDGDAVVASMSVLEPMAKGNALRILATFEPKGSLPGVPDAAALGKPELSLITVERVVCGPPGLPPSITGILSSAFNKTAEDPKTRALAERLYAPLSPSTPEHAAAIVREQAAFFEQWKTYLLDKDG